MDSRSESHPEPLASTDPAEEPAPAAHGAVGLVLGGKYRLVREIGRGGMGVVWVADSFTLGGAAVAVKIMTAPATERARERWKREVCIVASLRSQHVVQVFDQGVDDITGDLYMVMELLEGDSLGQRLQYQGVLTPGEVMLLVEDVGRALARAHSAGVIHRDLKPDNIFLVENDGKPIYKVLDFGLAKSFEAAIDNRALTVPGNAIGTPRYMSLEQLQSSSKLDHRADLWSLAVVAFECLVGQPPFPARDIASLTLMLWNEERPRPSGFADVPAGFDEWFARATHRDINQRFQSIEEFVDALAAVCGPSSQQLPVLPRERERPRPVPAAASVDAVTRPPEVRPRRNNRSILLAAALILIPGTYVFFQLPLLRPSQRASSTLASEPTTAVAPLTASSTDRLSPLGQAGQGRAADAPAVATQLGSPAPALSTAEDAPPLASEAARPPVVAPMVTVPDPPAQRPATGVAKKPKRRRAPERQREAAPPVEPELTEPSTVREY
jgi:eukaryotic-like serine/threonine-protein kinase